MDPLLERLRQDGHLKPDWEEPAPTVLPITAEDAHAAKVAASAEPDIGSPRKKSKRSVPPHLAMLGLCDLGALQGGLSVALDVRADELVGTLCALIGSSAKQLRVVDVREKPAFELRIRYGEVEEPWEIEDLYALVHNLNDLFREDANARAVVVLGEWEDSLQLWCVRKADLNKLFRADYFVPRNRHQLTALMPSRG